MEERGAGGELEDELEEGLEARVAEEEGGAGRHFFPCLFFLMVVHWPFTSYCSFIFRNLFLPSTPTKSITLQSPAPHCHMPPRLEQGRAENRPSCTA